MKWVQFNDDPQSIYSPTSWELMTEDDRCLATIMSQASGGFIGWVHGFDMVDGRNAFDMNLEVIKERLLVETVGHRLEQ